MTIEEQSSLSPMPEVVLIQAAHPPKPDLETHLLLAALKDRGIHAALLPWTVDIAWKDVPLVVVRTPWDYAERPGEFLAWAAAVSRQTLILNSYEVLKWSIHKEYMLSLEQNGIPIVPTRLIRASERQGSTTGLVELGFEGDTIVKPAIGVGALGLLRGVAGGRELDEHVHTLLMSGADVLVQSFVSSVETHGELSFVFFDGRFSHSIRKMPRKGDFRVQDHHGGSVVEHVATEKEVAVARKALAVAPGRTAYARVDLVAGDGGELLVMELELLEPELFLRYSRQGLQIYVDDIEKALRSL
ncbi:hypothetical protein K439DRAFT_1637588 [Ramaria rubella]|nr:hypothetical protein K439DRAFT_1637588 [Ramaria rubella]